MKKILFFVLVITAGLFASAQTDTTSRLVSLKQVNAFRSISASKATIARKEVVRLQMQLAQFSDSISLYKKEIDVLAAKMKNDLDSMGEMSEAESLRMQMVMERMSKAMQMISNVSKKMKDTQSQIIQNMK